MSTSPSTVGLPASPGAGLGLGAEASEVEEAAAGGQQLKKEERGEGAVKQERKRREVEMGRGGLGGWEGRENVTVWEGDEAHGSR
eukprot:747597-Hanusia_phi.AAC.2